MKLCVDCRHHKELVYRKLTATDGPVLEVEHMCTAREVEECSPVTGELMKFGMVRCDGERVFYYGTHCGPDGKLWEPKEKPPTAETGGEVNTPADAV